MKNKNILITGGSGFLGSHVADRLSEEGFNVTILDTKPSIYVSGKQKMIVADMLDKTKIEKVVKNHDVVFHFAALSDIRQASEDPIKSLSINVMGTIYLLEACRKAKIQHLIFSSSVYVSSEKGSFYRISKHTCEMLIKEYYKKFGINYTILRYGTLYGNRSKDDNSIHNYLSQAIKKGRIKVNGNGSEIREYIHVRDAAEAALITMEGKYKQETLIITGDHRMKTSEVMDMINEILGGKLKITYGSAKEAHYQHTPYTYKSQIGKKLVLNTYQDMGQCLLDVLSEIDKS